MNAWKVKTTVTWMQSAVTLWAASLVTVLMASLAMALHVQVYSHHIIISSLSPIKCCVLWFNLTRINSSHTALTTCAAHEPTLHSLYSLWVFCLKHVQYTHWTPATSTKLHITYNSRCNDLPKFGINYVCNAVKQSTCMQQWILLWGSMTMFRSSIFGWSIA